MNSLAVHNDTPPALMPEFGLAISRLWLSFSIARGSVAAGAPLKSVTECRYHPDVHRRNGHMAIGEVGVKARARLAFAAMAAGAVFVAGPACAQEFVMKFATQTINDVQHEFIKLYKAELEKATNNRIRVDIYPASQLGGAQRQSEGLRLGTIEAATGPAELFVGADPRFQGLAMAGLFKDIDHVRHSLLVPQVRQTISDLAASRGLMFNAAYVYDTQSFNTKAPMMKLADFSGKRIRVLASESEQAQVNSLGASAVPMSLQEVLPALQQGTIDGVSSGVPVFVAFKYYDAAPNILDTHLWAICTISLVSKVWYDRLPPDLQKAVMEAGARAEPQVNAWNVNRLKQDREAWMQHGGKIVTLPPAEQQEAVRRVTAAVQPILNKIAPLKEFYTKIKAGADTVANK
jgi:TRAP-type transport system periplasmic protein